MLPLATEYSLRRPLMKVSSPVIGTIYPVCSTTTPVVARRPTNPHDLTNVLDEDGVKVGM